MSQAFRFKFFKSRRFTPPYRLRRSQLVQKPVLRASKPPTAALIFSKPALRASNLPTAFSIFSKPALRASILPTAASMFQKPTLRASKPRTAVSIFSKAGPSHLHTAYDGQSRRFALQNRLRRAQFFKSRRFAP